MKKERTKTDSTKKSAPQESATKLVIQNINNDLTKEKESKRRSALVTGICLASLIAAIYFSGINPMQAIQTEIRSLFSFDTLKKHLKKIPITVLVAIVLTATSFAEYVNHCKKYARVKKTLDYMQNNEMKSDRQRPTQKRKTRKAAPSQ